MSEAAIKFLLFLMAMLLSIVIFVSWRRKWSIVLGSIVVPILTGIVAVASGYLLFGGAPSVPEYLGIRGWWAMHIFVRGVKTGFFGWTAALASVWLLWIILTVLGVNRAQKR